MEKPIETLIKSNKKKAEDRWYPTPVDNFRNGFIAMLKGAFEEVLSMESKTHPNPDGLL